MARNTLTASAGWSVVVSLALAGAACHSAEQRPSQAALTAMQTRTYDFNLDATYEAVVAALFDAGHVIQESDKVGGFLHARHFGGGFSSDYEYQIKISRVDDRQTSVRVATSEFGQSDIDEERTRDLFRGIEFRLLGSDQNETDPGSGG